MASLTTKIATLASFVILVGGFVAYRSGAFDNLRMASSSINEYEEEQDTSRPDSNLVIPNDNYMNTSKSGVIFSGESYTTTITKGKKGKVKKVKKQKDISPIIIPSSKSGAIFVPENEGL